ncbi:hypothetical protein E4U44_008207 [Claviceps purpurea]|nr:hypothetical protein E4U44_008207 [Claviceps purpurea]
MSESEPQPPTPSPSLPLPPGPDPSEGAMALEPAPVAPIADSAPGESQKTQETALPSSPKFLAPETMGATGAWKMVRQREIRAGQARAIAPSDGSGPGGNGRDGDGVGGCGTDSDMVAGGWHSEG